ncbi:extracellular solute-binding protein [Paenibacillus sp. P96]|uniref:Extracellular solute-binding protein n=1 Tax=Paenibacillus zeirhizosphaerae TaxID=2987519 RepID=A0ABT9FTZ5_9BACL|nr:extracellular solute-binding protein [Paenibacillus sp. P96]MDP4098207.1 extracellular solute-binding protein [Paenibacillus sp. P96]
MNTAAEKTDGEQQSVNSVAIEFWTPFSGGDSSYMNGLVQRYNRENKDKVKVIMKNNKSDDYYTKLSTAIVTEEGPEVAIVHASKFAQYVPAGFLTPIDETQAAEAILWHQYNPDIVERTVSGGRHYAVPLDTHFTVLYYNKKWLKEAGLLQNGTVVIEPGEEGFIRFLTTLRDHIPEDVAPFAVPDVRIDSLWLWWSLYSQIEGGGGLYNPDGSKAQVNMEAAARSLNMVASLYESKLIPPDISDAGSRFISGKAAVLLSGTWSIGSFEKLEDPDFGIMPLPQIYDRPGTWGDAHTLAFPSHSETNSVKMEAAVHFAEWLADQGQVWAQAGHIPAAREALNSEAFKVLPYRSDYAGAAEAVRYFPSHAKQGEINDALVAELEKIWHGKQTTGDMLQRLEPLIDSILGE